MERDEERFDTGEETSSELSESETFSSFSLSSSSELLSSSSCCCRRFRPPFILEGFFAAFVVVDVSIGISTMGLTYPGHFLSLYIPVMAHFLIIDNFVGGISISNFFNRRTPRMDCIELHNS